MIDINFLRGDQQEALCASMWARRLDFDIAPLVATDTQLRQTKTKLQQLQSDANALSKLIGERMREGKRDLASMAITQSGEMKAEIASLSGEVALLEAQLEEKLLLLPNILDVSVPMGVNETHNKVVRVGGYGVVPNPNASLHYEIEGIGIDAEAGAALAGSRFTVLSGLAAKLHRVVGQFLLDHAVSRGFGETVVPLIVNDRAMIGTGQLPKFADDAYRVGEDQWLIPTGEVSLTNLVAYQILTEKQLPMRLTTLTPCFRQEAGSAGRDTRGLIRQHQFEKVELVTICRPEDSEAEHERITETAEAALDALSLVYRRVLLCTGDTGFSARKTYDLEVFMAGSKEFREISSCSNCGDFQARRMQARYRPEGSKGTAFVHTLNGSALAVGRTVAALLEHYWEDGEFAVPDALTRYW